MQFHWLLFSCGILRHGHCKSVHTVLLNPNEPIGCKSWARTLSFSGLGAKLMMKAQ